MNKNSLQGWFFNFHGLFRHPKSIGSLEIISKIGFWFKVAAGLRFKPEEYCQYFEDLKRGTNKDIEPKDVFELVFKDNQEGGINQCFYFDKT